MSSCMHRNPLRKWTCSIKYPCLTGSCSKRHPCKRHSFMIAFPCRCRQGEERRVRYPDEADSSSDEDGADIREFQALVFERVEQLERDIKDLRRVLKNRARAAGRRQHM